MPASSKAIATSAWKGTSPLTITLEASPDFGRVIVEYEPAKQLIEPESLTILLTALEDVGEGAVLIDTIADALFLAAKPRRLTVTGVFHPRGGVGVSAHAHRGEP